MCLWGEDRPGAHGYAIRSVPKAPDGHDRDVVIAVVFMRMFLHFMRVLMLVIFREMQPDTRTHQATHAALAQSPSLHALGLSEKIASRRLWQFGLCARIRKSRYIRPRIEGTPDLFDHESWLVTGGRYLHGVGTARVIREEDSPITRHGSSARFNETPEPHGERPNKI